MILPPATLGMLGGGQLGRYFVMAAHRLGYKVVVLDPDPASIAGAAADHHIVAPYDDQAALHDLASRCAAVTCEFENVPAHSLALLEQQFPAVRGKVFRLGHIGNFEIADPYRQPREAFDASWAAIARGVADWAPRIRQLSA